jgi:hypothetical protein
MQFGFDGTSTQLRAERRNQASPLPPVTLPRSSVYSNGPATAGAASLKAVGAVVPPLVVSTTKMPSLTVSAP